MLEPFATKVAPTGGSVARINLSNRLGEGSPRQMSALAPCQTQQAHQATAE